MLTKEWVLGFVEGEGSFHISIAKRNDSRYGLHIAPRFSIALHKKDLTTLKQIRDSIGVGKVISFSTETLRNQGINISDQARYVCQHITACLKVQAFFKTCVFHTSKGKDFELWSQALFLMRKKAHHRAEGILKICRLRDQMNNPGKKKKNYRSAKIIEAHLRSNFEWSPNHELKSFL